MIVVENKASKRASRKSYKTKERRSSAPKVFGCLRNNVAEELDLRTRPKQVNEMNSDTQTHAHTRTHIQKTHIRTHTNTLTHTHTHTRAKRATAESTQKWEINKISKQKKIDMHHEVDVRSAHPCQKLLGRKKGKGQLQKTLFHTTKNRLGHPAKSETV